MDGYSEGKSQYFTALILLICMAIALLNMVFMTNIVSADSPHSSHIVMDVESRRVLSGDNIHARLPMASTTKVMTTLIAIESGKLDDSITITHDMVGVEGSSIYLEEGEILTIRELLYGLMLRSGNDSAVAIAKGTYGTIDEFVAQMNSKTKELGLRGTHFVNPHGLHDDRHYTSAYDLAVISSYAMHNDTFRDIVGTKSIVIGGETSKKRYLVNKNKILSMYQYGTGIKTGYTKKAGRCLVSSAERDGMSLVSVVLGEPNMWEYSIESMERAYRDYTMLDIALENTPLEQVRIGSKTYDVCVHRTLRYPIRECERDMLSYNIEVDAHMRHAQSGQNIGKLKVYYDKHLIFEEKIYTM